MSVSQRDSDEYVNTFEEKYIPVPLDFKSLRYRSNKLPETQKYSAESDDLPKKVKKGFTWNGFKLPRDTTSDIIKKILFRLAQFNRNEFCPFQDARGCREAGSHVVDKIIELVVAKNKKLEDADGGSDEHVGFKGNGNKNGNNKGSKYYTGKNDKRDTHIKGNKKNSQMSLRNYVTTTTKISQLRDII